MFAARANRGGVMVKHCWKASEPRLAQSGQVRLAVLFGSRAAGTARASSDFDIGILPREPLAFVARGARAGVRALGCRGGGGRPRAPGSAPAIRFAAKLHDTHYGSREFHLIDPDGYLLIFSATSDR